MGVVIIFARSYDVLLLLKIYVENIIISIKHHMHDECEIKNAATITSTGPRKALVKYFECV
jgi:hypothetical protein